MLREEIAIRPWRRGIGSDSHKVFDDQGRVIADGCGFYDGHLFAAAPELYKFVASAAFGGDATAHALIQKLNLEK